MREQVRIWRQQREQQAALEAQKRAEAAATQRPKTAPVKNRPLSAPTRRNMTPVRHISDPNDVALSANRKPLDSALHDKRVAEALQSQRSRAAAAEALKAKTKVCINFSIFLCDCFTALRFLTQQKQARPLELQAIGSSLAPQVPASEQRIHVSIFLVKYDNSLFLKLRHMRNLIMSNRKAHSPQRTADCLRTTHLKGPYTTTLASIYLSV